MSIEARSPPPQFVAKLRRARRAGRWAGFALQILFVAALVWLCTKSSPMPANLQAQQLRPAGFLANTAGFDVSRPIPVRIRLPTPCFWWVAQRAAGLDRHSSPPLSGSWWRWDGCRRTGCCRASPAAVSSSPPPTAAVPDPFLVSRHYLRIAEPQQSIVVGSFFLSSRGFVIPKPISNRRALRGRHRGCDCWLATAALRPQAIVRPWPDDSIWPYVVGMLISLPLLTSLVFGARHLQIPDSRIQFLRRLIIPEFVALTLALSTYTAFITEIVRASVQSVHTGKWKQAARSGCSVVRAAVDRGTAGVLVILPPLTTNISISPRTRRWRWRSDIPTWYRYSQVLR
jgi:general L-amino acid transport system permease protein